VSSEYGIVVQDSFMKIRDLGYLVGVTVPFMYFTKVYYLNCFAKIDIVFQRIDFSASISSTPIIKKPFRDFVGYKSADPKTLQIMLDFSFYLTVGNMDEAFKVTTIDLSSYNTMY
jgi:intraflagellar transport protein 140